MAILFSLVSLPFLIARVTKSADYLEPIYILSLSHFIYFVFRVFYIFYRPEEIVHKEVFDIALLNRSLLYVILGFSMLLLIYYSQLPKKLSNRIMFPWIQKDWPAKGLFGKLLLLYILGFLIRIVSIRFNVTTLISRNVGYISSYSEIHSPGQDYLANFQQYPQYAVLALMLSGLYKKNKTIWIIMYILLAIEVIYNAPTTSKAVIFTFSFMFILWYNYRKHTAHYSWYFVLGVFGLLILFPWINAYRTRFAVEYGYFGKTPIIDTAKSTARYFSDMSLNEYLDYSFDAFAGRAHGIDSVCLVVKDTPSSHDFLKGMDYIYIIPNALIPRAIWENKPFFKTEEIFERYYWYQDPWHSLGSFPGPTYYGDLYMNFGFPGILVGMLVLGFIYRFLYEFFVKSTGASSPGLLFYFVLLLPLLQIEGSPLILSEVFKRIIYLTIFHIVLKFKIYRKDLRLSQ